MLAVAFLGCVWGHIFCPWLGFKGGKGIAVAVGCLFVTFGMDRRVRPTYSKTMGRTFPALTCPKCGGIQEGNFVYRNYRNRGGVFSNPADRSPLEVPPLPVCADDRPRECRWVFDGSSLGVEAFTVIRPDVERTISRPA